MSTVVVKMRHLRHVLLGPAAALIATGYQAAPAAPREPAQVKLGEAFTLAAGQDASQNKQQAKIGPYTVHLTSLDPYPKTPTDIPFDDYRAVLLVDKD